MATREIHQLNLTPLALRALLAFYNSIRLTPELARERAAIIRQLEGV